MDGSYGMEIVMMTMYSRVDNTCNAVLYLLNGSNDRIWKFVREEIARKIKIGINEGVKN